jgi:hypothetical protein
MALIGAILCFLAMFVWSKLEMYYYMHKKTPLDDSYNLYKKQKEETEKLEKEIREGRAKSEERYELIKRHNEEFTEIDKKVIQWAKRKF